MGFVLAELEIPVRVTGMGDANIAVSAIQTKLSGMSATMKTATMPTETHGKTGEKTGSVFDTLRDSITGAAEKLTQMAGVDMSPFVQQVTQAIGQFGSMGIVVASVTTLIAAAVKAGFDWGKAQDAIGDIGMRVKLMGGNAEEAKIKVKELTGELKNFGIAPSQSRAMLEQALGRGQNINQAMNTVRAATALSAALGISEESAARSLESYEEIGTSALRRLPHFREMIRLKRSDSDIQKELNEFIRRGVEIQRDKIENNFEGVLIRIEVALGKVWAIAMKVFGPVVVGAIETVAFAMSIVGKIADMINFSISYLGEGFIAFGATVGVILTLGGAWWLLSAAVTAVGAAMSATTAATASFGSVLGIIFSLPFLKIALAIGGVVAVVTALGGSFKWLTDIFGAVKEGLGLKTPELKTPEGIAPGRLQQSTMISVEHLWEKFAAAGVDTMDTGKQSVIQLERLNTTLSNIAANGLPQPTGRPPVPAGAV